ncbi:MAG TPA: PadR family transcriptional regulator [Steroidobacteraceae bacterium]|nr:PadR family transcriptional regulator [Steroidobacteraceae bacterium]
MAASAESLGSLEHIVLLAVLRLREDAYGMTVLREIASVTGRDLAIGAVYSTLTRLESKGFIRSWAGEPTAERGGRAKRYFHLTPAGREALRHMRDVVQKMSAGLKGLQVT